MWLLLTAAANVEFDDELLMATLLGSPGDRLLPNIIVTLTTTSNSTSKDSTPYEHPHDSVPHAQHI